MALRELAPDEPLDQEAVAPGLGRVVIDPSIPAPERAEIERRMGITRGGLRELAPDEPLDTPAEGFTSQSIPFLGKVVNEMDALVSRGKELIIDRPGARLKRGVEQLRSGQPFRGAGNVALSVVEPLAGLQKFVFGDPAANVTRDLGGGETAQELVSSGAEVAGGMGVSGALAKVPGMASRVASEALGFGKPKSPAEVSPPIKSIESEIPLRSIGDRPTKKPLQIVDLTEEVKRGETIEAFAGKTTPPEMPKFAKNINLNRIETPDDVKNVIRETADRASPYIDKARRGTMAFEETEKIASELGMTPDKLLRRRRGQAFNAEEALASRQILTASAENVFSLAKQAVTGGDEEVAKFANALGKHVAIQQQVSGIAAEAGRSLSSFRIPAKGEVARERVLKSIIEAAGGRKKLTGEIAARLAKMDPMDTAQINMFIRDLSEAKTSDKIFEVWVNSLLSGPVTHIVNSVSNTLTTLTRVPERAISAGIDFTKASLTGGERERFIGETAADLFGMWRGLREGVRKGLRAFQTEIPSQGLSKIETTAAGRQAIKGPLGKLVRTPGRLLMAEDEFFKAVDQTGELHALAFRQAAKEGKAGAERAARIGEILANPSEELVEKGRAEALYRTFQTELGPVGKGIARVRDSHPAFRLIAPFLRTPINIAKFGLERTPLDFIIKTGPQLAKEGLTPDVIDRLSRNAFGSLVGAATVTAAYDGRITGGGPRDPSERKSLMAAGWRPYSVKIGDQYHSYGRLEPLGIVVGLAADYAELSEILDTDEAASKISLAISRNLTNKTFLIGVSDLLNAVSDPERYGQAWIRNFAGTVVPTGIAQVARARDPLERKPQTVGEQIKSRIPGLRETVGPLRDIWGQPVAQVGSSGERLFSPIRRSEISKDPATLEIVRLGVTVPSIRKEIMGVELTPQQAQKLQELSGRSAKVAIGGLIKSEQYAALPDEEKANALKNIFNMTRKMARERVLLNMAKENPAQVRSGLMEGKGKKAEEIQQGQRRYQRLIK